METNLESEILYIKKIMNDSRKSALDNGKYYILWGVLIGICCLITYFNYSMSLNLTMNYFWFGFVGLGWALSAYWGFRDGKREKTSSLGKKIIAAVWSACGFASLVIFIPGQLSNTIDAASLCGLMTAIFGIGYFVSGTVYSDKMLIVLAFIWWGAGSWMFFIKGIDVLLVYGLFLLLFQVVPGFILFAKWKKELAGNTETNTALNVD